MPAGHYLHRISGGLVALVCALVLTLATSARANVHEVVFALNTTELHTRPGEAAPVVGHVEPGDELEVLGDQGRWLRVRNGKQIGWLTRTEVGPTKPAEPRKRVQKFAGKRDDATKITIVSDHVRGFDDPETKAKQVIELSRGSVVTVLGHDRDWLLVEQEDGTVGWIPDSAAGDAGKLAGDPRKARSEPPEAPAGTIANPAAGTTKPAAAATVTTEEPVAPQPARRWSMTVLAGGGAQTFQMEQTGEGAARAVATGPLATLTAQGSLKLRGKLWAGIGTEAGFGSADLTFYAADSSPSMSTKEVMIDAYGVVGMGTRSYVALRGGVHYSTLSVSTDRMDPMLLGERVAGATVGVTGGLPLGRRFLASAAADVMPVGAQKLDKLPAGTLYGTSVKALWARAMVSMALPAHLVAGLSYRFGAASTDLTDGAAMPKTATRTDLSHVVTAGVGLTW
ncbi:MAG TPA: SH3 domain-containing protein [Kofleriaceae bacterium]|nr:SH3 domain-containing protein [Kofleriaceae bacterium]